MSKYPNPRIMPGGIGPGLGLVGDPYFFDDFVRDDFGTSVDVGITWLTTLSGSTPTIVIGDGDTNHIGGVAHITTSSGDNDSLEMQANGECFAVHANKDIIFEARLLLTAAAAPLTSIDWCIGLATTDTAVLDGTTEFIGFRTGAVDTAPLNAGGADIICSVGNTMAASWTAATISEADTGIDYVDNEYFTCGFHVLGSRRVKFYINGAEVGNFATEANIPIGDALTPTFCIQNNAGAVKQAKLDYIFVAQARDDD